MGAPRSPHFLARVTQGVVRDRTDSEDDCPAKPASDRISRGFGAEGAGRRNLASRLRLIGVSMTFLEVQHSNRLGPPALGGSLMPDVGRSGSRWRGEIPALEKGLRFRDVHLVSGRLIIRCILMLFLGAGFLARGAELQDFFSDRETVNTSSGEVSGNNSAATFESEEPRHGGKRGGHSLWLSWVAPVNGLASIEVVSTEFDTLLGVYVLEPGNDPPIRRLERVADNDDDRDVTTSRLEFGVRAGERYEIAVDGYAGAVGSFLLRWNLQPVDELIPSIFFVTTDRAAQVGETVTLALNVGPGTDPKLHWFFNDQELEEEEGTTLVIPNFQPANVGQYRVRVEVGKVEFFSEPVELQISSEGIVDSLARNKPEDALESGLIGTPQNGVNRLGLPGRVRPAGGPTGLARGYNGTQIFNTVYAGRDRLEPLHCGLGGGSSYWLSYQPPESGDLELDTDGSSFDTVLEVYTFDPPLLGYQSLRSIACDNDSGINGKTSRLHVACESGRTYLVVVDGVNGARGLTYLNYTLQTNGVANVPPVIRQDLSPVIARAGDRALLSVEVEGTAPLQFLWKKDGLEQAGETNALLVLDPVRLDHAGSYSVEVFNAAGSVTNPAVDLAVWVPPVLLIDPAGDRAELRLAVAGALRVVVETGSTLDPAHWVSVPAVGPGTGGEWVVPVDFNAASRQFFRVRFE